VDFGASNGCFNVSAVDRRHICHQSGDITQSCGQDNKKAYPLSDQKYLKPPWQEGEKEGYAHEEG